MNTEEAIIVTEIMMTAGGGQADLAYDLCMQFIEEFPEHADLVKDIFDGVFGNYETFDQIQKRISG